MFSKLFYDFSLCGNLRSNRIRPIHITGGFCFTHFESQFINLCGDFNEEHIAELMKDAPEGVEIHYAAYLPEELRKLEALEEYKEYGQIIFGGVEEPVHLELQSPEMNTHTVFIKDLQQALQEAERFAKAGVDGIELCSSFDLDMTKSIIAAVEAIDPTIPVGSNGITL